MAPEELGFVPIAPSMVLWLIIAMVGETLMLDGLAILLNWDLLASLQNQTNHLMPINVPNVPVTHFAQ
jgi:hypothetical protein